MISAIIGGKEVKMKKTDVIRIIAERDRELLLSALELMMQSEELKKVAGFADNCEFAYYRIQENQDKCVYEKALGDVQRVIENHGIPKKGHLNDYARILLSKLDSPEYASLLGDSLVAISYGKVRAHLRDHQHAEDYEAHLNHLNAVIKQAEKANPRKNSANKKYH